MKLVSLTIARNSSWCIKATITHALRYVDAAVVLLHSSTDKTVDILRKFDERVTIANLDDEDWNEMVHRQFTLDIGRDLGGTHFLILDDDEILTNNLTGKIRDLIEAQTDGQCLCLPLVCCWRSLDRYRVDSGSPFSRAYKSVAFKNGPGVSWNKGTRYQHHHTAPYGTNGIRLLHHHQGGYMHLQHANWNRLVIKQTWYMCMEITRYGSIHANYKGTMSELGLETAPVPNEWWGREKQMLKLDQEPWQLEDIKRMIRQYGPQFFSSRGVNVSAYV